MLLVDTENHRKKYLILKLLLKPMVGLMLLFLKKYFTFRRCTASQINLLHGSDCRGVGPGTECSLSSSNEQLHLTAFVRGNKNPPSLLHFSWMLLWADAMHRCRHLRGLRGKGCMSQEGNYGLRGSLGPFSKELGNCLINDDLHL